MYWMVSSRSVLMCTLYSWDREIEVTEREGGHQDSGGLSVNEYGGWVERNNLGLAKSHRSCERLWPLAWRTYEALRGYHYQQGEASPRVTIHRVISTSKRIVVIIKGIVRTPTIAGALEIVSKPHVWNRVTVLRSNRSNLSQLCELWGRKDSIPTYSNPTVFPYNPDVQPFGFVGAHDAQGPRYRETEGNRAVSDQGAPQN